MRLRFTQEDGLVGTIHQSMVKQTSAMALILSIIPIQYMLQKYICRQLVRRGASAR